MRLGINALLYRVFRPTANHRQFRSVSFYTRASSYAPSRLPFEYRRDFHQFFGTIPPTSVRLGAHPGPLLFCPTPTDEAAGKHKTKVSLQMPRSKEFV